MKDTLTLNQETKVTSGSTLLIQPKTARCSSRFRKVFSRGVQGFQIPPENQETLVCRPFKFSQKGQALVKALSGMVWSRVSFESFRFNLIKAGCLEKHPPPAPPVCLIHHTGRSPSLTICLPVQSNSQSCSQPFFSMRSVNSLRR